ncbi:hypothetical protein EC991_009527, partial [Linnemannia zychae]
MMQPTRLLALALLAVFSLQEVIAAPNLIPGVFKIKSLTEGNTPVGVNYVLPGFQTVYNNGPVNSWVVRKEGDKSYRLSVGGYPYTGIEDNKLAATVHNEHNVEWLATYREYQDAYTIEPADSPYKGWTASSDNQGGQVSVEPIL